MAFGQCKQRCVSSVHAHFLVTRLHCNQIILPNRSLIVPFVYLLFHESLDCLLGPRGHRQLQSGLFFFFSSHYEIVLLLPHQDPSISLCLPSKVPLINVLVVANKEMFNSQPIFSFSSHVPKLWHLIQLWHFRSFHIPSCWQLCGNTNLSHPSKQKETESYLCNLWFFDNSGGVGVGDGRNGNRQLEKLQ